MRLITYNIQFCRGRDGVFNVPRVARELAGGDIIALQEVERNWDRSVDVDQPLAIADLMPGYFWAYGVTFDICKGWKASQPARPAANRRRQFGNMILSRYPILTVNRHLLPRRRDPAGGFTMQRGLLETVIAAPEGLVRVMSTHLDKSGEDAKLAQVAAILDIHAAATSAPAAAHGADPGEEWSRLWQEVQDLPPNPPSAILMGDMNSEPGSDAIAMLTGPNDGAPALQDAWTRADKAQGDGATCYRDFGAKEGVRVDYCLLTPDLAEMVTHAAVQGEAQGSEHQPLIVDLA